MVLRSTSAEKPNRRSSERYQALERSKLKNNRLTEARVVERGEDSSATGNVGLVHHFAITLSYQVVARALVRAAPTLMSVLVHGNKRRQASA